MIIEAARADQLSGMASFINDCWRAAYRGILDQDFLDKLTTKRRVELMSAKSRHGMTIELACDDQEIAGLVMYGPSHFPDLPTAGEISMLYVRPDLIGQGLGHRLLVLAEGILADQGYTKIALDVFSANTRAIQFYVSHGYSKVADKPDDIDGRVYALDIMAKSQPSGAEAGLG